jgi:hypothetical protein
LILPGLHPGEPVRTATSEVSVPAGSLLVIRASGIALDVVTTGGLAEAPKAAQSTPANGSEERRFLINEAGGATVRGAFRRDLGWQGHALAHHCRAMALYPQPVFHEMVDLLRRARVAIVSDPHTGPLHARQPIAVVGGVSHPAHRSDAGPQRYSLQAQAPPELASECTQPCS